MDRLGLLWFKDYSGGWGGEGDGWMGAAKPCGKKTGGGDTGN